MNGERHTPVIVVGASGSPASAGALRWAADEAEREHGTLRVVRSWKSEPRAFYAHPASGPQDAARQHQLACDGLATMITTVLASEDLSDVTAEVVEGVAERVLVDLSAGADLLVLGSASGLTDGRSIGPVIRGCLSRAHCPVVVVGPEGPPSREPDYLDRMTARLRDYRELLPAGAVPGPRPSEETNWRSR
ncbi:MAG TPA: universal stress protein [Streptosporangiaceae bacterium]|nr:universal stress protein [Streptosporangiaceae bacterium]